MSTIDGIDVEAESSAIVEALESQKPNVIVALRLRVATEQFHDIVKMCITNLESKNSIAGLRRLFLQVGQQERGLFPTNILQEFQLSKQSPNKGNFRHKKKKRKPKEHTPQVAKLVERPMRTFEEIQLLLPYGTEEELSHSQRAAMFRLALCAGKEGGIARDKFEELIATFQQNKYNDMHVQNWQRALAQSVAAHRDVNSEKLPDGNYARSKIASYITTPTPKN